MSRGMSEGGREMSEGGRGSREKQKVTSSN